MDFPFLKNAVIVIQFLFELCTGQIEQMTVRDIETMISALFQRDAIYLAAEDILNQEGRYRTLSECSVLL